MDNFIKLAEKGFYNRKIFHRVIPTFMVQGGCPNGDGSGGPGYTIKSEAHRNTHKHILGAVSMGFRPGKPDSGGSQFFICLAPQKHLDKKHTVFGQVTKGIDVVQAIGKVKTAKGNKPAKDVVMKRVYIDWRKKETPKAKAVVTKTPVTKTK